MSKKLIFMTFLLIASVLTFGITGKIMYVYYVRVVKNYITFILVFILCSSIFLNNFNGILISKLSSINFKSESSISYNLPSLIKDLELLPPWAAFTTLTSSPKNKSKYWPHPAIYCSLSYVFTVESPAR